MTELQQKHYKWPFSTIEHGNRKQIAELRRVKQSLDGEISSPIVWSVDESKPDQFECLICKHMVTWSGGGKKDTCPTCKTTYHYAFTDKEGMAVYESKKKKSKRQQGGS